MLVGRDHAAPNVWFGDTLTGRMIMRPEFKVLGTVVRSVAIFVVDGFATLELAA